MRISDWSSDVCSSDRHKRYTSQRHNRFHSLFQISPGQAEMVFSDTMTRATRNKLRAFVTAATVAAVCLNQTSAHTPTPTSSAAPEDTERKSDVLGRGVSVRVVLGGARK